MPRHEEQATLAYGADELFDRRAYGQAPPSSSPPGHGLRETNLPEPLAMSINKPLTLEARDQVVIAETATLDVRYSFTAQFLCSSAIFARRCAEIERIHPNDPDEPTRTEHRGLVTTAIMHCAAAVEAESAELLLHGPGNHLGSDGIDTKARDLLKPLAECIDRQEALKRYKLILRILGKPPLAEGEKPWQTMKVLIGLRNELVHYKSKWGGEMEGQNLFDSLRRLGLPKPPFIPLNTNFFPHQFLSAACAAWSVRTAVAFINAFYERLEIESRLKPHMAQFEGL